MICFFNEYKSFFNKKKIQLSLIYHIICSYTVSSYLYSYHSHSNSIYQILNQYLLRQNYISSYKTTFIEYHRLCSTRCYSSLKIMNKTIDISKVLNMDCLSHSEGSYIVIDDKRSVIPYIHCFKTYAKGRWLQRELLEVLVKEFGAHPMEYWKNAIKYGHVRINNQLVPETYRFKNSDLLVHRTHRHEPPVFGKIKFVGECDKLFAVNKPSSMPIHACGSYRYNSLMMILDKEPLTDNQPKLYPIHRLDRLTSGLMIFAKSSAIAADMAKLIQSKSTTKTYLARVKGIFPKDIAKLRKLDKSYLFNTVGNAIEEEDVEEDTGTVKSSKAAKASHRKRKLEQVSDNPINTENVEIEPVPPTATQYSSIEELYGCPSVGYCYDAEIDTSELILSCPVGVVNYRQGIHACLVSGKPSISSFKCLGYDHDSDTSLMECELYTGRTHQLRLHLEFLGNPIANDPCYGGTLYYDEPHRRDEAVRVYTEIRQSGYHPLSKPPHLGVNVDSTVATIRDNHITQLETGTYETTTLGVVENEGQQPNETDDEYLVRTCRYCCDQSSLENESIMHCSEIWLHALRYESKGLFSFETEWPTWANISSFCFKEAVK